MSGSLPPIPFNRPTLVGHELDYVRDAVEGGHTSAAGPYTARVTDLLRAEHGAADVLLTTSCTDALEMSAMLLDAEPGGTVIVPSYTFVSTAIAFVRAGMKIVFADIEDDTLGIDPAHVAHLVDDSTRAVTVVHYGGISADLAGVEAAMDGRPVPIIEDNAHGLFATESGNVLGTRGRMSTLSFHETKNFTCGEGGALVLNDPADADRAHVLLHKGTNRRAFMLGQVDKYSWQDLGSSFGLSEINAAFLLAQLEVREQVLEARRAVFDAYHERLTPLAAEHGLSLPRVAEGDQPGYHLYYTLLPDRETRNRVLAAMRDAGVMATFHYVPLHSSPGGRKYSARPTECPVSEDVAGRLIRFPFHNLLTADEIDRVVETFDAALQ